MRPLTGILLAASLILALGYPGTGAQADRGERHYRAAHHPGIGHRIRSLPRGHLSVRVNHIDYRYHGGVFYRPAREGYVVVRAPLGARVRHLPAGAISFGIGARRYWYLNSTYFIWDAPRREYVVVAEPEGAAEAVVTASTTSAAEVFVYPSAGQSEEQRDRDRYECWLWAVEQTGYDPSADAHQPGSASDYRRANAACLEGRGYTVK